MAYSSAESGNPHPDFLFIGEHPAVDFANTHFAPRGEMLDLFESWTDVLDWLVRAGLSADSSASLAPAAAEDALAAVRELRRAWHKELERIAMGHKVSDAFLKSLNVHLGKETFSEKIEPDEENGFRIRRSPVRLHGKDQILVLLAQQIAAFLVESNPAYVHKCASPACVLYFYDTTKNHRRQWCSHTLCGNRHKVAAFRERRARLRNQAVDEPS